MAGAVQDRFESLDGLLLRSSFAQRRIDLTFESRQHVVFVNATDAEGALLRFLRQLIEDFFANDRLRFEIVDRFSRRQVERGIDGTVWSSAFTRLLFLVRFVSRLSE